VLDLIYVTYKNESSHCFVKYLPVFHRNVLMNKI